MFSTDPENHISSFSIISSYSLQPHEVEQLVYMVKHLTDQMHRSNKNAEVIWYDSVIKTGQLRWQNKLCEDNR